MNYFIDEFKNYISVIKNYSQNTVNSYLSDTALFLDYIKTENIPIENITEFNIMSYISFLGEKGTCACFGKAIFSFSSKRRRCKRKSL